LQESLPDQNSSKFVSLPRSQVIITLVCVMLAMFLAALDQTIVSTATPRIIADLGGFDKYTWITTGYMVASTTAAPIVGKLSDIYGRKWIFIGSVFVFMVGSVLCGFSENMTQLIIFRIIQGIGGGTIMAVTFISIADLFPPSDRGKYIGLLAACFGLASVIGPTLGGFLTDTFSWKWIFFVNVPLAGPVVFLLARFFPDTPGESNRENRRIDYPGICLLIVGVVLLLVGLSLGGVQYEWTSFYVVGPIVTGLISLIILVIVETKTYNPILPLNLFKERMVTIGLILSLLTGFAMFGAIIFVPLYFQGVLAFSATSSGTFLTPMMLGIVFGAAISGQILSRTGGYFRIQGLVGVALMAVGVFLFSTLDSTSDYPRAVSYIILLGFGLGSTFPTFTIAVQNFSPPSAIGAATSFIQFLRTFGGLVGLSLLGSLMSHRFVANLDRAVENSTVPISNDLFDELKTNPRVLVDPDAQMSMVSAEMPGDILAVLRNSLSEAIGDVFSVCVAVLLVSFFITMLLNKKGFPTHSNAGSKLSSR
ncbi:MAG: MFS transporter, partial [SAR202 cluster bacterium]|nr:MFS transporter [SAR202 cluster bacterium]